MWDSALPKGPSADFSFCRFSQRSIVSNKEVFDFLESAAKKYGIEVRQKIATG